jgi:drug/metabolite transporter (DMT)-like permease
MRKNPVAVGVLFALLSHLVTWLTLGIPTYLGSYTDAGLILAFVLLALHIVLLFCFNHRAHFCADTFRHGLHFSVAVLISVFVLGEQMTVVQIIGGMLILGFTLWNEIQPKQ